MRIEAGAAAVALAAATLMHGGPTAAQEGDDRDETLQVSPTSGPPGTVITVEGEGCTSTEPGPIAVLVFLTDTTTQQPVTLFTQVRIDAGAWSAQLTVPQAVDPDDAFAVRATCAIFGSEDTITPVFDYAPVAFDVTAPPTTPSTTAPPTSGPPAPAPRPPAPPAEPVIAEPTFTG